MKEIPMQFLWRLEHYKVSKKRNALNAFVFWKYSVLFQILIQSVRGVASDPGLTRDSFQEFFFLPQPGGKVCHKTFTIRK